MTKNSNGLGKSLAYLLEQNKIKNLEVSFSELPDQNTVNIQNNSDHR